jgi:hypothetical protein
LGRSNAVFAVIAALDDVPVSMVHPPTAMPAAKMAAMAASVAGNRIVFLRDRYPLFDQSMEITSLRFLRCHGFREHTVMRVTETNF